MLLDDSCYYFSFAWLGMSCGKVFRQFLGVGALLKPSKIFFCVSTWSAKRSNYIKRVILLK